MNVVPLVVDFPEAVRDKETWKVFLKNRLASIADKFKVMCQEANGAARYDSIGEISHGIQN